MSVNYEQSAWLLNDGRAGHWRQVRALAHYLPLAIREIAVHLKSPWRQLAPRRLPFCLASHPEWLIPGAPPPDVIISCGRQSALAARCLQAALNSRPKTVQILDCGISPRHFNWVIAPEHDGLHEANVLQTLGSLNPVDAAWLSDARTRQPIGERLPGPRIVVLLGGPSRHFRFTRNGFSVWLADLCGQLAGQSGSLVLVESPRSPDWIGDTVKSRQYPHPIIHVPWKPGTEWEYAATLAGADCLLVTADSVNLLSEACASGKPVLILGMEHADGKLSRFCQRLVEEGFARSMCESVFANQAVRATRCLRETERVAGELIKAGLLT